MKSVRQRMFVLGMVTVLIGASFQEGRTQDKNPAEELFKKMEEKLLTAKTLQFSISLVMKDSQREDKAEGTVTLEEGNKASVEVKGGMQSPTGAIKITSDGQKLKAVITDKSDSAEIYTGDAPTNFNGVVVSAFGRAGIIGAIELGGPNLSFGPLPKDKTKGTLLSDGSRVTDFKIGKDEKIGDRMTSKIEMKVIYKQGTGEISPDMPEVSVTLWIDKDTYLPVKGIFNLDKKPYKLSSTETYRDFKINGKDPLKKLGPQK